MGTPAMEAGVVIRAAQTAARVLNRCVLVLTGVIFSVNIINIVMNVFTRYVMSFSFIWTDELARYLLVCMVLLAAAPTHYSDEHMKIDVIAGLLPPEVRRVTEIVKAVVIVSLGLFLVYRGFLYADGMWRFTSMGLRVPMAIPLYSVPVGMLLFVIQYLLSKFSAPASGQQHVKGV